jgi:hypothetical protein
MMNSDRMAGMVYIQLVEQTANLQLEVAQQLWVNQCFGADALPVNKYRRSHRHILKSWAEDPKRTIDEMNKKVAENIAIIKQMEEYFETKEAADLEAFATYLKERMAADSAK